jgi:apolipoprotein D and lipocalin family protein
MSMLASLRAVAALGILLAVTACSSVSVPEGIEPVTGFEVERYMGRWY